MYNNKNVVQKIKSSVWSRVMVGAMMLGMSMSSQASLIGLDLEVNPSPDILSQFLNTDYNADTNVFTADGTADQLFTGSEYTITEGMFSLTSSISDTGELAAGGTISISGMISSLGFTSGTLLTGNLTMLGFTDNLGGGDPLEFLFDVTGGDAQGLFGSFGGVILSRTTFDGNWATDFGTDGNFNAVGDTGIPKSSVSVPEPTSMWLLGSGLIGLAGFARRKQNK